MHMTLAGVSWIVVVNGLIQLSWLVVIIRYERQFARMTRAVAGLVYQESDKTRARLDELSGREVR
jgi:hypothetical protein